MYSETYSLAFVGSTPPFMIFQSDKSFRATVCVADEEKQLFLSEIQLEREAYCSTQREKEGELLI